MPLIQKLYLSPLALSGWGLPSQPSSCALRLFLTCLGFFFFSFWFLQTQERLSWHDPMILCFSSMPKMLELHKLGNFSPVQKQLLLQLINSSSVSDFFKCKTTYVSQITDTGQLDVELSQEIGRKSPHQVPRIKSKILRRITWKTSLACDDRSDQNPARIFTERMFNNASLSTFYNMFKVRVEACRTLGVANFEDESDDIVRQFYAKLDGARYLWIVNW